MKGVKHLKKILSFNSFTPRIKIYPKKLFYADQRHFSAKTQLNNEQMARLNNLIETNKFEEAMDMIQGTLESGGSDVNTTLLKVKILSRQMKIDEAKQVLSDFIKSNVSVPADVYYNFALILSSQGNINGSLEMFQKTYEKEKDFPNIIMCIGETHLKLGQYEQAIKYLDKEINANPQGTNIDKILFNKALALYTMQNYNKALETFNIITGVNPTIFAYKGRCLLKLSKRGKAILEFEKALALEPRNVAVLHNLADAYHCLEEKEKEVETLKKVISVNPKEIHAYEKIISVLKTEGKYADILPVLNMFIEVAGKNSTIKMANLYKIKINVLTMLKRYDEKEMLDLYKKIIQLEPNDPQHYFFQGLFYQDLLKKTDKAIESYDEVLKRDPQHLQALINKMLIADQLGNIDNALECVDKLITLKPRDVNVHYNKAQLLYKAKRFEEYKKTLEKCLEVDPVYEKALMGLGDYEFSAKNYAAAVKYYTRAASESPLSDTPMRKLAYCSIATNQLENALRLLNHAVELNDSNIENFEERAVVNFRLGKQDASNEDYNHVLSKSKEKEDNQELLTRSARMLIKMKKFEVALEPLNELIKIDSSQFKAFQDKLFIYISLGKIDKALEVLEECYRVNTVDHQYYLKKGQLFYLKKDYESALKNYNEAIRLGATSQATVNAKKELEKFLDEK